MSKWEATMARLMAAAYLIALVLIAAVPPANAQDQAVLAANASFYKAFDRHDFKAMDALWAKTVPAVAIRPGWPAIHGRAAVMESWRSIIEGQALPSIKAEFPRVFVTGASAFVTCFEILGAGGYLIATNIFVMENGRWRMVHHYAGPAPPPAGEKT